MTDSCCDRSSRAAAAYYEYKWVTLFSGTSPSECWRRSAKQRSHRPQFATPPPAHVPHCQFLCMLWPPKAQSSTLCSRRGSSYCSPQASVSLLFVFSCGFKLLACCTGRQRIESEKKLSYTLAALLQSMIVTVLCTTCILTPPSAVGCGTVYFSSCFGCETFNRKRFLAGCSMLCVALNLMRSLVILIDAGSESQLEVCLALLVSALYGARHHDGLSTPAASPRLSR
jgi:hypothetical protein